jgi:N6-adenosine-specific RNA methylase IME4
MNITKHISNLPVKPEDLIEFVLIGRQALKAQRAKLKAITLVEKGLAAKEAALLDTQDMAEILLYAEAKLGAMLEKIAPNIESSGRGTIEKKPSLPSGITKKQSHYAQELSRHEEAIAETVAKAREKGEVPVRQQVLRLIQEKKPKPETPLLPKGKYNVLYVDPPWEYRNTGVEGAASKQYSTMSVDKLCKLPVPKIVAANAVLFLWTTNPILQECFPVLESWGFEYKTNFCWFKSNRKTGVGFYVRGIHELLLICVKGSMLPKYTPLSVIKADAGKHSMKPVVVYEIIEKMYPKSKYVELFARIEEKNKRNNWTYWGNEVGRWPKFKK